MILDEKELEKLTLDDFKRRWEAYLSRYYDKHLPFKDIQVISTEKQISFQLDGWINFLWFIDRLDKVWDTFIINDYKTNKNLPTDSHMLGRMLRAPQRMKSLSPPKVYLSLPSGICCSLLTSVVIQQLALDGAKKIASTLLKSQLSWPKCRLSGKRKNKNKTSERSWVRHRCKRQNCRD